MKPTILIPAAAALILAACAVPAAEPTAVQPADTGQSAEAPQPKAEPAVKMTAKKVPYPKDEFAIGGPYTCAKVVITNQTKGNLDVNPFFFEITGADSEKREASVGVAKGEVDSLTLAPGEKASGVVCSETTSPPKVVTFTDGINEAARAEVG